MYIRKCLKFTSIIQVSQKRDLVRDSVQQQLKYFLSKSLCILAERISGESHLPSDTFVQFKFTSAMNGISAQTECKQNVKTSFLHFKRYDACSLSQSYAANYYHTKMTTYGLPQSTPSYPCRTEFLKEL